MSKEGTDEIATLDGLEVRVMRIPVLSTSHISETSRALLTAGQAPWLAHCAPYEFGWFVAIPAPSVVAAPSEPPIPEDLKSLFIWADKHGFGWIRLDADGDQVEGLPIFP